MKTNGSRSGWPGVVGSAALAWAALPLGLTGWGTRVAAGESPALVAHPLAARLQPEGTTMFVEMPPAATGLRTENRYADPRMKGELYQEFETSSIGTGVAIGDYDGDGRPDIFVVSKTESCRLFRNLGHFKFEDVTEAAGVADHGAAAKIWKEGATFVDVNNDGRLDIYVCRTRAPNLLYINQGDGTFKEEAHAYGLDVNDASVMAAFCDYDRDGWLDVYIATNILDIAKHPKGQRGYLFHNNGDGTFTNVTDRAGIFGEAQSHSATWWDYDDDGWPDLYVAYDYGLADTLYHNNRDGTFTDVAGRFLPHTSFSSMGADLGDVNNDGRIDFFVADMAATTHDKDQHSLADARGRTEEPLGNATSAPKYHRNALLLNTGTGYCLEGAFLAGIAATDWTWSARLEDLDNDGRLDLQITNGFPWDPGVDVVTRMMRAESPAERIKIMYASPEQAENNRAYRNRGNLEFEDVSRAWGLDQKGVSFGAAFGDLDGDGNLDLVYSNYHGGVTVLRNECATGHRVMIDLRGTESNRFGVGAVVRVESALGVQAGQLVLARGYMSSSEPALHFGLGEDTVIKRVVVWWPSGQVQTFENVPVDRRLTITEPTGPARIEAPVRPPAEFGDVSQTTGLSLPAREEALNETSLQPLLPERLNRRGPGIAVGEEDGDTVIAMGGTTVAPLRVARETAGRHFVSTELTAADGPAAMDDGPVLWVELNGDGREDLVETMGGDGLPGGMPRYQPKVYLNNGNGGWREAADVLPPEPLNAGAVVAGDFNRDGRLDLFIGGRVQTGRYPQAPRSALLRNRGGRFEDVTDTLAPGLGNVGMVTGALWSDVDGDGWPDLLVTLEWGGVKCFHNRQGQGFEDWSERLGFAAAGTGWWTGIAAADFNGDGQPDYVVGNVGLNTQYHADAKHPALLYAGDFKGDGGRELIEAYYEGGTIYPWRSRRDLGAVFPSLLKRYPLTDLYARATLEEVFGRGKLAQAERFAATELRSGVFLSQPDGTYRFEPLPRLAQIAPLQGLVAGDFDGDGHADIYAVQNSYAPIPAVGRFDGGLSLLLRGDGHGHFEPVWPAQSGLLVPGDAKGLAVLDLDGDGWPDFLVTRNNATSLAFRNRGRAGAQSLRVVLHGPAGNPTAVGARVTAALADGTTQTSEVYAGSGYYSQSTAACFFGSPQSNPVRHLRIRWPDGRTSSFDVTNPSGVAEYSMPAE